MLWNVVVFLTIGEILLTNVKNGDNLFMKRSTRRELMNMKEKEKEEGYRSYKDNLFELYDVIYLFIMYLYAINTWCVMPVSGFKAYIEAKTSGKYHHFQVTFYVMKGPATS